uniref:RING-type domain-containing protein n=1 Tax=Syphacia muris TaxID=451379 RepID=A0A0N5ABG7_9BILA
MVPVTLTDEFNEDDDPSTLNQAFIRGHALRNRRKRHVLSSDSETEDSSSTDTSASLSSFDLELAAKGREALSQTITVGDVNYEPVPSTSRPRRTCVQEKEARKRRNRRLARERLSRRCRRLPPLVVIDSSSSDDEDMRKRHEQEEADYLLAVKISAELNKSFGLNSNSNNLLNTRCKESDEDDAMQCIICFEKPVDAVGCIYCQQLLGCKKCVMKWRQTSNISKLNRSSPLSRGVSSANHKTCPLCRIEWEDAPEVAPWGDILVQKMMNKS